MNFENELKDCKWEAGEFGGKPNMLLNYYGFSNGKLRASYDVFDASEFAGRLDYAQVICRRLNAAMNYCKGMTIEELERGK